VKLLEAFACLRPVVSTTKGAEGLAVIDGQHLLLREPADFAATIVELLDAPSLAARLAGNALTLVEEHYSWPVAARRVEAAVRALRGAP
jgi:glycosyltransferase involved in cell wall biosynthesis